VFGKKKKGENSSDAPQEQVENVSKGKGKPKVSKGFGNTIILFIMFFIVFTVIVTGVAFFADKIDISGNKNRDLEELAPKEKMTDPKKGESTEYIVDEKGNLDKKDMVAEEAKQEEPTIPAAIPAAIPEAKPESKPLPEIKKAPLPPVVVKPVIKKPEPKKQEPAKAAIPSAKPSSTASSNPLGTLSRKVTNGDFVVQLASFQTKKYAEAEQAQLKKLLPDAFVVRADLGDKGIWYRLRCFNGISHPEAVAKAAEIAKKTKYKPYPMKK